MKAEGLLGVLGERPKQIIYQFSFDNAQLLFKDPSGTGGRFGSAKRLQMTMENCQMRTDK